MHRRATFLAALLTTSLCLAGTSLSATSVAAQTVLLLEEDFESGAIGWTHAPRGGADTWHLASSTCSGVPLGSTMFVSNGNAGADCRNNSSTERSQLLSPSIPLPSSGQIRLSFDALSLDSAGSCLASDPFSRDDVKDVGITTDGGLTYTVLNDCFPLSDGNGLSVHHEFGLGSFAGRTIQVIFVYDTRNQFFGDAFAVDNVVVTTGPLLGDPEDFLGLRFARFDDFAATDNVEDVYAVGGEEVTVRVGEPVPPGAVFVRRQSIPERSGELRFGDGDTFADPGELINLDLMLENFTDAELTGVQVRVSTDSPAVGCVTDPVAFYGTLGAGEARFNRLEDRFRFVVDTNEAANSLDLGDGLQRVSFSVSVSADAFGQTQLLQRLILVLDLDVLAGSGQTARTFFEGFEDRDVDGSGTIDPGETLSDQLGRDAFVRWEGQGRGEVFLVDGPVCPSDQPLNPGVTVNEDFVSFEEEDWHIHTPAEPDRSGTGKSHGGANSLHYGRHLPQNDGTIGDGYRLNRQIAVRLQDVNLNLTGASELDFWHIVELMGWEYPGFDLYNEFEGEDRGLVEVRADSNPDPLVAEFGAWERVEPYLGMYEATQDQFYLTTASFDPGDDVNPANPADPLNTMCFPLLTWIQQGSSRGTDAINCTDADDDGTQDCGFSEGRTDPNHRGPGFTERGETGVGVWVHTKFNLARYAGRRIQARFIVSTIDDAGVFVSYLEQCCFALVVSDFPNLQSDDGWYVDDVRITETVAEEIHLAIDTTAGRDGTPEGIATCPPPPLSTLDIGEATGTPGGTVSLPVLLASIGGIQPATAQFEVVFDPLRLDLDPVSVTCGDSCAAAGKTVQAQEIGPGRIRISASGEDTRVIPGGELVVLPVAVAPGAPVGTYALGCERPLAIDAEGNAFDSRCLGGSVTVASLLAIDPESLSWNETPGADGYDVVRGDLLELHSSGGDFSAAMRECLANNHPGTSLQYAVAPFPGEGSWFLVRSVLGGEADTYDSSDRAQVGSRDAEIEASPLSCP